MAWFRAFRDEEGFTQYSDNRSAVSADKSFVAVLYVCSVVFLASLLAALGNRGKERRSTIIRVAYSVCVGSVILICLYGHGWQQGFISTECTYIFWSSEKFQGEIGMMMGLGSVNITLSGFFDDFHNKVQYSESFKWFTVGELQSMYKTKLMQGVPAPIVTVAEYFSIDGGGLRWGRYFREAGYYTHLLLWTSFSFWLITTILLCSVLYYGAVMCTVTGMTMWISVIVYHVLQPRHVLRIPFDDEVLQLRYGWCFWIVLAAGILTTILGFLLLVLNAFLPKKLASFFLLDNELAEEDDLNCYVFGIANDKRSTDLLCFLNEGFTPDGLSCPNRDVDLPADQETKIDIEAPPDNSRLLPAERNKRAEPSLSGKERAHRSVKDAKCKENQNCTEKSEGVNISNVEGNTKF